MWPILIVSIIAVTVVLERIFWWLGRWFRRDPKRIEKVFTAIEVGDVAEASRLSRDTRDRIAAEKALRASEERFRSLTELSSDWYWEQDEQFRFTTLAGPGAAHIAANGNPSVYLGLARWEIVLSQIVHWAFYVIMIGMPLTGWLWISAGRLAIPTLLYGVVPWPDIPGSPM